MSILIQKRVVIISCLIIFLTLIVSGVGAFSSVEGNINTFKSIMERKLSYLTKVFTSLSLRDLVFNLLLRI